ncbi:MAG: PEP-CTERM sorting domain-containing protein [Phycisphaeraceae bacterium]
MSTIARFAIALSALSLLIGAPTDAAVLVSNGIQPFDTNLGTLNSVTVELDPAPTQTGSYDGFVSEPNHAHLFQPQPVSLAGLGTFNFPTVQTSFESHPLGGSHTHVVNPLPATNVYSGGGLAWFLDANSPTIGAIAFPQQQTQTAEGHEHTVLLSPVLPRTTYHYTPVPEPGSLAFVGVASLALLRRRR